MKVPLLKSLYSFFMGQSYFLWQIKFIYFLIHELKISDHNHLPCETYPKYCRMEHQDTRNILPHLLFLDFSNKSYYAIIYVYAPFP